MKSLTLPTVVLAVLVLSGCTATGAATTSPIAVSSPSPAAPSTTTPTPTPTPSSMGMALPDSADFEAMDPALFAANTLKNVPWSSWDTVDVNFGSPSGNVGCAILGPENQELWGCAINEKSWEFPTSSPDDYCFDAKVSCGRGIESEGAGMPHPRYRSDPGFPGAFVISGATTGIRTLEYGQSVTFGDVTCFSETAAITCINAASGHGFVIARDRNDIF